MMRGEGQLNWAMWKAERLAFRICDLISTDGNRLSAPFARLGWWLERSRVRWFPDQFRDSRSAE